MEKIEGNGKQKRKPIIIKNPPKPHFSDPNYEWKNGKYQLNNKKENSST